MCSKENESVSAGQRARAVINAAEATLAQAKQIMDDVESADIAHGDDFITLRDETQTSSALIETSLASLSTLHLDKVAKKTDLVEKAKSLKSSLESAAQRSAELDDSMIQANKLWIEYDENYRRLTLFIEKCDQFDARQETKLPIDPIHWKTDVATINSLNEEIPGQIEIAEKLKTKISALKDLCNCESDRMGTQLATLEIMLEAIPGSLSDRLEMITTADELHTQFSTLD